MRRALLANAIIVFLIFVAVGQLAVLVQVKGDELSKEESAVVSKVNGTRMYELDVELERMTLDPALSAYSYRSSGSVGADQTASWIQDRFAGFGLETSLETFEFSAWNLQKPATMEMVVGDNQSIPGNGTKIDSFVPEHYSWPTPEGGVYGELVVLPLPRALNREAALYAEYDAVAWLQTNLTGKVLLVGREVRWSRPTYQSFKNKVVRERPLALIFTWWYDWMGWAPPMLNSIGGMPASRWGPFLWDSEIPVGWVSYSDGLRMRESLENNTSTYVQVTVPATIANKTHYNVVGRLSGSTDDKKMILVTAHYDSVTDAGFCDNGAGVAGMLELAQVFSEASQEGIYKSPYTLVFVGFAGEELGLVGSVEYFKAHAEDLKDIVAVINIDCIGNELFEVSEAFPDERGLNLQDVLVTAARDVGIKLNITETGGSDQETFRNPRLVADEFRYVWETDPGIANMTRIKSSIMISSYPLFYSDIWINGSAGWIHTPYDNSTSTSNFGEFVTADRLESQVGVTALSLVRVQSILTSSLGLQLFALGSGVAIVAASILVVKRSRLVAFLRMTAHSVLRNIGMKELIIMAIVFALCFFFSFALFLRIGREEIILRDYPIGVTVRYYGGPFEFLGIREYGSSFSGDNPESVMEYTENFVEGSIDLVWGGFVLDAALFAVFAFAVVYLISWTRRWYWMRKDYESLSSV